MMMMARRWQFLLGALTIFAASGNLYGQTSANSLTEQEKHDGWQLLFDGQSMSAWRGYKKDKVSDGWKVVEGEIRRVDSAGDLVTREMYGKFELSLEYKISKGGNSGLMYHVLEEANAPWHTGPEVQIQDNKDGHDPQLAGWLYQLYKPAIDPETKKEVDATKPAGEWNELRIRITPNRCEQFMNGVKYCEYVMGSDDWNQRVAQSKFSAFAGFGKAEKGHICLQDHGNPVAFRNIKIRPLD